jgi:tetratricopeptide (TPR) repeat protein
MNREKVLDEAQKHFEKKRFEKAIAEYQKLVADDPNDVRSLIRIGESFLKLESYADAIRTYEAVGNLYASQGFGVRAAAVFKQVRELVRVRAPHLEDRFGHIVLRLAELHTQLDLKNDALGYYDEVATKWMSAGRARDAIDVLKRMALLDPQNAAPHLRLAEAYTQVRDVDASAESMGQAAELLARSGRRDDAIRLLERTFALRPEARWARSAAELYLARGGRSDAMTALQRLQVAVKENSRDLETLSLLATAFDLLGQAPKALEVQKEAARVARDVGDNAAFQRFCAALLERAPNDAVVRQIVALKPKVSITPPPPVVTSASVPPGPLESAVAAAGGLRGAANSSIAAPKGAGPFAPMARRDASPSTPPPPVAPSPRLPQFGFAPMAPSPGLPRITPSPSPPQLGLPPTGQPPMTPSPGLPRITPSPSLPRLAPPPTEQPPMAVSAPPEFTPDEDDIHEDADDLVVESASLLPLDAVGDASVDEEPLALRAGGAPPAPEVVEVRAWLAQVDSARRAGEYETAVRLTRQLIAHQPDLREPRDRLCDLLIECGDQDAAIQEMLGFAARVAQRGDTDEAARLLDEVLLLEPAQPGAIRMLRALGYDVAQPSDVAIVSDPSRPNDAPLPSFELDEPSAPVGSPYEQASARGSARGPTERPAAFVVGAAPATLDDPFLSVGASAIGGGEGPGGLGTVDEGALDEIDFYLQQGMLDDAEAMLDEQLARLPRHPLLLERRQELDAARAALSGSPHLASELSAAPSIHEETTNDDDQAYAIAQALEALDGSVDLDGDDASPPMSIASAANVEAIFEQFKAGIAEQVAESDSATHYDLGMAYKEMGLVADALSEFELASRDPNRACVAQSMIGMMHVERGNLDAAIDAFLRAVATPRKSIEQEVALTYELGHAYAVRGNAEQALYYFQLVARIQPYYDDPRGSVAERIEELGPAPLARASGDSARDPGGDS